MDVMEVFKTMPYGPAPESPSAADAWLEDHEHKFGLFINNTLETPERGRILRQLQPGNRHKAGGDCAGRAERCGRGSGGCARRLPELEPDARERAGALPVRHRPQHAKTSPAAGRARIDG